MRDCVSRMILQLQQVWVDHVRDTHKCCSPDFWTVFMAVQRETVSCRDKVLRTVKSILKNTSADPPGHTWAGSNRTLRLAVKRTCGDFWDRVVETHTIPLKQFGIPTCDDVQFSFVDPLWVWIQHANLLHQTDHELQWDPKVLQHPETKEEAFGAGVEYGLHMRAASEQIPAYGKVAEVNLSWDSGGTTYQDRDASPICVQVMNTNSSSVHSVGLVSYVPQIEISDALKQADPLAYARMKHYVLQVQSSYRAYANHCHVCVTRCRVCVSVSELTVPRLCVYRSVLH